MLKRKSNLTKITPRALFRRVRETGLLSLRAAQARRKRPFSLGACLGLVLLGHLCGCASQRGLEQRSRRLHPSLRRSLGLTRTPSDTTLGRALQQVSHAQVLDALKLSVCAMHKRGELAPHKDGFHQVAIDGKQVHWLGAKSLRAANHPALQAHCEDGKSKGATLRVLRATHVSGGQATCIWQSAIPGSTNEVGHLPAFIDELADAYGRSQFIHVLSLDAGLCSLQTATQLKSKGWEYLARIKMTQPSLLEEARRTLVGEPLGKLRSQAKGHSIEHRIWVHDLGEQGWLQWKHARSFVRIVRVRKHQGGEEVLGERLWVSSLQGLKLQRWADLCRGHWGCENGQHCVADKHFGEDRRVAQLSQDVEGLLVVSVLRAMAMNLLNVLRKCRQQGYAKVQSYNEARSQVMSALERELKRGKNQAFV